MGSTGDTIWSRTRWNWWSRSRSSGCSRRARDCPRRKARGPPAAALAARRGGPPRIRRRAGSNRARAIDAVGLHPYVGYLPPHCQPFRHLTPSARAAERDLTYYESYDPRSLDPALSTDVPTGEMVTLAYDGLTQFDADGRLLPGLADRWTAGPDASGRKYVFHLRPGVKFHDGTPLTAAAVRASLLRVLSPATKGGRPWPLYPIAGAEAYAAGR